MKIVEDIRHLPIDITFSRLGGNFLALNAWLLCQWLVDRKRIPANWRKRLTSIRARIFKEFSSLPKDTDLFFQTLEPAGIGYLAAKSI